jgi:hypothetical protein
MIPVVIVWGLMIAVVCVAAKMGVLYYAATAMTGGAVFLLALITVIGLRGPRTGPAGLTYVAVSPPPAAYRSDRRR